MNGDCPRYRAVFDLALDGELESHERASFDAHVAACSACRAALRADRAWLASVAAAAPLHEAPADLRDQVLAIVAGGAPHRTRPPRRGRRALVAVAVVVLVGLAVVVWSGAPRPAPPAFARMAVETHLRHIGGNLPLEIAAASPEQVSDWFRGKVPFHLTLPSYPEEPGHAKPYRMEGGRLVAFENEYAAYVAYEMEGRPISLVVTSSAAAEPEGGEEIPFGGLRFHFEMLEGLKVITWSDKGLTYALVSDFEGRGQASCTVCHSDLDASRIVGGLSTQRGER
jgi:anti-sigma factor RsiW